MAQRGAWTPQKVRERIRTTMLVKRLQNHMLGKLELSTTQIKAAEILLRKSLPDLQAIEATVSGEKGGPVLFQLMAHDIPPKPEAD